MVTGPHGTAPEDVSAYDVGGGTWRPGPARDLPAPEATDGDELAVAFTTSGSTGKPKLAAHRESAVVAHARADAAALGIGDGDVVVCALPLSGVFGFSTALAGVAGGAACLLEPVFDGTAVVADMARWRATHLVGGDDLVSKLAAAWQASPRPLPAWRWLGMADFIGKTHELARWAEQEFGTHATGVYGSSEVFALTACWPGDEPAPRRWRGGGRLVSGRIQARVADPVTEESLPAGHQGELQLRGYNVVDAYLGDPDAGVRSFTTDGWFRTGDLVELDADGAVTYVCRMGDVLRLHGFLVDPAEIEQRLAEHHAVSVAKVVGVRGDDGFERAVAYVVPVSPGAVDAAELREWCGATLATFKVPSAIELLDEMPTTSGTNGTKIRAATLREWAQRRHGARREMAP
ncbi:AMP-binding protein [Prauserella oleivorans]